MVILEVLPHAQVFPRRLRAEHAQFFRSLDPFGSPTAENMRTCGGFKRLGREKRTQQREVHSIPRVSYSSMCCKLDTFSDSSNPHRFGWPMPKSSLKKKIVSLSSPEGVHTDLRVITLKRLR